MRRLIVLAVSLLAWILLGADAAPARFEGRHYRGVGDAEYLRLLETARVEIFLGGAKSSSHKFTQPTPALEPNTPKAKAVKSDAGFEERVERVREFHRRLLAARVGKTYERAHRRLLVA